MQPRPSPRILRNIFSDEHMQKLLFIFKNKISYMDYDKERSRHMVSQHGEPRLEHFHHALLKTACEAFQSETLKPSYCVFAHYEGETAGLERHRDKNACTYTIDLCLYQKHVWPLWVENKSYELQPGEALAYYGEDQVHWRERMSEKENQVAMIFFHFVEPEHPFFQKLKLGATLE